MKKQWGSPHGPGSGRLERAAHRAGAATPEELMYAEVEVAGCGVMNHRRHSELTAAATLVLLLSVLLLLLQPTHLGNAPALLALNTWLLFGMVYVAVSLLHEAKAPQLPRSAFRSALFDRPPPFLPV
jgi:hypothetical protein